MEPLTFNATHGPGEDFNFTDARGFNPVPIWSLSGGVKWCSMNSSPDNIAPDASDYSHYSPYLYPQDMDDTGKLIHLNLEHYVTYYRSREHWLGWNPASAGLLLGVADDPLKYLFDRSPVPTVLEHADVPMSGDSDRGADNTEWAGYSLGRQWIQDTLFLSQRVADVSMTLVMKNPLYGPNTWTSTIGDVPPVLERAALDRIDYTHSEIQQRAAKARRALLNQLGFLNWFLSVETDWKDDLDQDDVAFVNSLHLPERPKRGYLFDLKRDFFEITVPHLVAHDVPVHYLWTDLEEESGRFLRYSPAFLSESETIRANQGGGAINLRELPSYARWLPDLLRYDIFFQDLRVGRVGRVLTEFRPEDDYGIVDFFGYGVRPLDSTWERRVCAERFKGLRHRGISGKMITFHRQNPIGIDEPILSRTRAAERPFPLTDFGRPDDEPVNSEVTLFFESTYLIRELVKNRYAPRSDRVFSTYDRRLLSTGSFTDILRGRVPHASGGEDTDDASRPASRLEPAGGSSAQTWIEEPLSLTERLSGTDLHRARAPMSPSRRSGREEDLGMTGRWARDMARQRSLSFSPRRRSSRSRSPARRGDLRHRSPVRRSASVSSGRSQTYRSFTEEYSQAGDDVALDEERPLTVEISSNSEGLEAAIPATASVAEGFVARPQTPRQAIAAIREWATYAAPLDPPPLAPCGLPYGDEWLWDLQYADLAYLVCHDDRSLVRLKAYAAYGEDADLLRILVRAIRFGVSFGLYVKVTDVREFSNRNISSLERTTLSAVYAPGRADTQLVYGLGNEALYAEYLVKIGMLLSRPHARAFIGLGGVLSFVAQLYDPDLVFRYLRGPSMQVSEHDTGDKILLAEDGVEFFLTTDRVSPSEISLLLGHVATGDPKTETSLWPHPSIFENESLHASGAWTPGYYQILINLRDEINSGNFKWHTRKMWGKYFRAGNMGTHAPAPGTVVTRQVFKDGEALMWHSFPISWNKKRLGQIRIPEEFDPLAHRG
ncbi:hypothetical protein FB451DRAFT_1414704 [Mycena latifolia]|nr:hypothetical protein FB451DRAFT_1414704 [Mycena latifolia]